MARVYPLRYSTDRATPPQAKSGATLRAAVLFRPDFVARALQTAAGMLVARASSGRKTPGRERNRIYETDHLVPRPRTYHPAAFHPGTRQLARTFQARSTGEEPQLRSAACVPAAGPATAISHRRTAFERPQCRIILFGESLCPQSSCHAPRRGVVDIASRDRTRARDRDLASVSEHPHAPDPSYAAATGASRTVALPYPTPVHARSHRVRARRARYFVTDSIFFTRTLR